jgi:hypothetical protein
MKRHAVRICLFAGYAAFQIVDAAGLHVGADAASCT